jgi:hypothetical protein
MKPTPTMLHQMTNEGKLVRWITEDWMGAAYAQTVGPTLAGFAARFRPNGAAESARGS